MRWLMLLCALVGCKRVDSVHPDDALNERSIRISVDARPGVPSPETLIVVLTYADTATLSVDVGGAPLPISFEVDVEGRTGPVTIAIEGVDAGGNLVGKGSTRTTFEMATVGVRLENLDFVVNSTYGGNQFLTNDFEAGGLQLAALDYTWLATFRDECTSCNIYARRFDSIGTPLVSIGGAEQFPVNASPTLAGAIPAVATNYNGKYLAVWDFTNPGTSARGIACVSLDAQGGLHATERIIANEPADVVSVSPLPFGNFVVTWQTFTTVSEVRAMTVTPSCEVNTEPFTVSGTPGTSGARRGQAVAAGEAVMYAWIVDGEVYVRYGVDSAIPGFRETLIAKNSTSKIDYVRVVSWGLHWAVAVRWSSNDGVGPGRIELYYVTSQGVVEWGRLITDQSGSDFASNKSFGFTSGQGGRGLLVWHVCPTGPGSCDVRGRFVDENGTLLGDELMIPTTTNGDQTDPAVTSLPDFQFVVAWNDRSGNDPDRSGSAVRARIIYLDVDPFL